VNEGVQITVLELESKPELGEISANSAKLADYL
jgi:hypothetical protein